MLKDESKQAVDTFLFSAKKEFNSFIGKINGTTYEKAAKIISEAQKNGGRLHITGIGKPSHVSEYMASLLSSTGNPCYFLHGTEAVHGSCGQLVAGDVVVCVSNSGETAELKSTAMAVRNNGCQLIAVTGNPKSWLGTFCDACLYAGVEEEGGPLNRAPRNSILAEILTLQALSVALQVERGWSPQQYVRCHPGGKLGEMRDNEK